jgi:hypothetical protein
MKSVILRSPRRADDEESGEGRKSPLPQTLRPSEEGLRVTGGAFC